MDQESDRVRLTAKQIEALRLLPDVKLRAAFLLLWRVQPETINNKLRAADEVSALNVAGDPEREANLERQRRDNLLHAPHELWLEKSQIIALGTLPIPHLRKALRLMKGVRQKDLNGLILQAQYGVSLETDELRQLMTETDAYDRGRHTNQKPAQETNDDMEA